MWFWVAIEPESKEILGMMVSKERNMLVAERFLSEITDDFNKYHVYTHGGTWYPQSCKFLEIKHHIHSSYGKSLMERTMQYIKDRTEGFDDYFPCRKERCKLLHIKNWIMLFVNMYNKEVINA
jgi:putative transposase